MEHRLKFKSSKRSPSRRTRRRKPDTIRGYLWTNIREYGTFQLPTIRLSNEKLYDNWGATLFYRPFICIDSGIADLIHLRCIYKHYNPPSRRSRARQSR